MSKLSEEAQSKRRRARSRLEQAADAARTRAAEALLAMAKDCRTQGDGWCGRGACAPGESSALSWNCVCALGWRHSVFEFFPGAEARRCLVSVSFMTAYVYAWLFGSLLVAGSLLHSARSGSSCFIAGLQLLSCAINAGTAIALLRALGHEDTLGRAGSMLAWALGMFSVLLFAFAAMVLTTDKYLLALQASAARLTSDNDQKSPLAAAPVAYSSKSCIGLLFGLWVLSAVLLTCMSSTADCAIIVAAFWLAGTGVVILRVHMVTAELDRQVEFVQSQLLSPEISSRARALRRKLVQFRRAILIPAIVNFAGVASVLVTLALPEGGEIADRLDFVILFWVPPYLGCLWAHAAKRRRRSAAPVTNRSVTVRSPAT